MSERIDDSRALLRSGWVRQHGSEQSGTALNAV
jgi:hypothetical protein